MVVVSRMCHLARTSNTQLAKFWLGVVGLFIVLVPVSAFAITSISQGYLAYGKTSLGSIVSLQKNSSDFVNPSTTSNTNNILGVVIGADNSLLSLSSDQANQIQVATTGIAQVLVSNINGSVYAGDPITASPISGVGMKATANARVVGTAQQNLSNTGNTKQSYTDKKGHTHSVIIGQVPTLINVSYYFRQPDKTILPAAIQNVANAFAGKTVNSLPIIISMAIFIVTLMVVVSIIYSVIHSSIISVGRNPMSQSAIYHNLIQISLLVVAILAVSLISIYMVLTRF